jgi:hypothetical protein
MESISWHPDFAPQLSIGDTFWFILSDCPSSPDSIIYRSTTVTAIRSVVYNSEDGWDLPSDWNEKCHLVCKGYEGLECPIHNWSKGIDHYLIKDIYLTEQAAKNHAQWTPINIGDYDWQAMIGDRDDDSHGDSELGVCCANLSGVRDELIRCRKQGGLIRRDLDYLAVCTSTHENLFEGDFSENIDKIMRDLNIKEIKAELDANRENE